uniref:Putative secreted mucin n=1 Tax=Amblyomma tuberculatum TaxID=48802 RepID=A0A6M2E755_9ACAR
MPASLPWIRWLFFAGLLACVCAARAENTTEATTEETTEEKTRAVCKGELHIPFMPCRRYCRVSWIAFFPKYERENLPDGTNCKRFLLLKGICKKGKCVKIKHAKVTKPPRVNFTDITRTAEPSTTTMATVSND